MKTELKYSGYTAVPSDYECQDGALELSLNAIYEDGALHALPKPKVVGTNTYREVLCCHNLIDRRHLIVLDPAYRQLCYLRYGEDGVEEVRHQAPEGIAPNIRLDCLMTIEGTELPSDVEVKSATTIGSIVFIHTSKEPMIIRWDVKTQSYVSMGSHIPEPIIRFDNDYLKTTNAASSPYSFPEAIPDAVTIDGYGRYKIDKPVELANAVYAALLKYHVNYSGPFFVRYALRLFDGSLTMHSAPILFNYAPFAKNYNQSTHSSPRLLSFTCSVAHEGTSATGIRVRHPIVVTPTPSFINAEDFEQWKDVISSVDVFISKPIALYNTDLPSLGLPYGTTSSELTPLYRSVADIQKDICNVANFYLFQSYPLSHFLGSTSDRVATNDILDILPTLEVREQLTDDFRSHDTLIADASFAYNSRLAMPLKARMPFEGFHPSTYGYDPVGKDNRASGTPNRFMRVTIGTDAGSVDVVSRINTISGYHRILQVPELHRIAERYDDSYYSNLPRYIPAFIFYPDAKATNITFYYPERDTESSPWHYKPFSVDLRPHSFLNGAFAFLDESSLRLTGESIALSDINTMVSPSIPQIPVLGSVYLSEVNCPFIFPPQYACSIAGANVSAISTAAKALSQGQFGQFPLYAFTDQGIWAIEISSAGTFTARQPISREVAYAESVTQIDSAVLFATAHGIMCVQGSSVVSISDAIWSSVASQPHRLPHLSKILSDTSLGIMHGHSFMPIPEFLKGCRMVYDYTHQLVYVFHPEQFQSTTPYAYVFSLRSKTWGLANLQLKATVNVYPSALAVDSEFNLIDMSASTSEVASPQLLVTRPIKLPQVGGSADVLKTISGVMFRGTFPKNAVRAILYGSRNLIDWTAIYSTTSSRMRGFSGTPWKYFKLAMETKLRADESLFSAEITATARMTNRPR